MTNHSARSEHGHGPLVRQLDRVALFFQQLCDPKRRERSRHLMSVSHPERTADEPSRDPVQADTVAEAMWRELSRSDLHPDKWQFLGTQLDTAAPLLVRLHAAIANGEFCVPCLALFTGTSVLHVRPSDQDVKLWRVHEAQDNFEARLAANGKAGALPDYAETVLFCLNHKNRTITQFYDSGGNPMYRDGHASTGIAA